ncbi:hypothetical protein METY_0507 [Methylopila sp. Yamaguchi]|nr:hypothetical protein METY_0507 [Methylopila sp. Yamaguchi]
MRPTVKVQGLDGQLWFIDVRTLAPAGSVVTVTWLVEPRVMLAQPASDAAAAMMRTKRMSTDSPETAAHLRRPIRWMTDGSRFARQ